MRKSREKKLKIQRKQTLPIAPPSSSLKEMQEVIKKLEVALKEEQDKREKIETHLIEFRIRSLKRQKQFFKIVDRSNKNKINTIKDNAEIEAIYNHILHNFDAANEKTHNMLQVKYKLNHEYMERRVREILDCMEKQLLANKQLSKENIRTIKNEVEETLQIAKGIQQQNYNQLQTIKSLEFKNQLLREEKKLLINELVLKKKIIIELSEEINHRKKSQSQQPLSFQPNSPPKLTLQTTEKHISSIVTQIKQPSTPQHRKTCRKNHQEKRLKANSSLLVNKADNTMRQQKTIQNLQSSLKRVKSKNFQLGSIVTQLQSRDKEINEALDEYLTSKQNQESKESLRGDEKILRTMKTLKRRLSMVQSPKVSCGWNNEMDDFLENEV